MKTRPRKGLSTVAMAAIVVLIIVVGVAAYFAGTTLVGPPTTVVTTLVTTAAPTTIVTTAVTTAPTTLPKPYAGVKIRWATLLFKPTEGYEKMKGEFEEATGIEVEIVMMSELEMYEKQLLDLSTGAGTYDVMSSHHWDLGRYVRADWLAPLDQFYENPELTALAPYPFNINDFFESQLAVLTYDGHLYGIPWMSSITTLMYNKEYFQKYGVAEPPEGEGFWTLDEFEAAAAKLHHPEEGVYGVALRGMRSWALSTYIWCSFFRAEGGEFFDKDWQPTVNSAAGVNSLLRYARMLQEYGPPGAATWTWEEAEVGMAQGKVAMICDASNLAVRIEDPATSQTIGKIGYAAFPGGWPGLSQWSSFINAAVSKERQEAAWLWIQWMNSKETCLKGALIGATPEPPLKSVYADPTYQMAAEKWGGMDFIENELAIQSLAYKASILPGRSKDFMPITDEWFELGDLLSVTISKTIAGEISLTEQAIKAELDAVAAEFHKVMDAAGYYEPGVQPPPINP